MREVAVVGRLMDFYNYCKDEDLRKLSNSNSAVDNQWNIYYAVFKEGSYRGRLFDDVILNVILDSDIYDLKKFAPFHKIYHEIKETRLRKEK